MRISDMRECIGTLRWMLFPINFQMINIIARIRHNLIRKTAITIHIADPRRSNLTARCLICRNGILLHGEDGIQTAIALHIFKCIGRSSSHILTINKHRINKITIVRKNLNGLVRAIGDDRIDRRNSSMVPGFGMNHISVLGYFNREGMIRMDISKFVLSNGRTDHAVHHDTGNIPPLFRGEVEGLGLTARIDRRL